MLKIKRPRTEKFKKSLAYAGPKRWNDLPDDFHQTESKTEFKRLIFARSVAKALSLANTELAKLKKPN